MPKIEEQIKSDLALVEPAKYKVLLHNDDYTTMDFVVEVLMSVFHKNLAQSEEIMFTIHKQGKAICGIYSYDIAETKVFQVKQLAKKNEFPLLATMEEV